MVDKMTDILGTVNVERVVECPPSCHWHGTNVTHRTHYKRFPTDVVSLQDALKRLGVEEVDFSDWYTLSDFTKSQPVAFNDEKVTNVSCGGKVLYAFTSCMFHSGSWYPTNRGYYVVRREDGKLGVTSPA